MWGRFNLNSPPTYVLKMKETELLINNFRLKPLVFYYVLRKKTTFLKQLISVSFLKLIALEQFW